MKVNLTKEEIDLLKTLLEENKSVVGGVVLDKLATVKKTFKCQDSFIITEGEKYNWSGCSEGYMTITAWKNEKCKIVSISDTIITIFDYVENKEWNFSPGGLVESGVRFKMRNKWKS